MDNMLPQFNFDNFLGNSLLVIMFFIITYKSLDYIIIKFIKNIEESGEREIIDILNKQQKVIQEITIFNEEIHKISKEINSNFKKKEMSILTKYNQVMTSNLELLEAEKKQKENILINTIINNYKDHHIQHILINLKKTIEGSNDN